MILNLFLLDTAFSITRNDVPAELGLKMKKRRFNALKKAYDRLLENPFISYENGKLLILSDSVTENGEAKFYRTSKNECRLIEPGNYLCPAFWDGYPCWHRATLEIVENYIRLESAVELKTNETVASVNSWGVASVNS